jgi:SARP family transcriptional regulator, regulator of embCAB operon
MAEKGAELGVPAVLAMLLINRNRPVATDALIGGHGSGSRPRTHAPAVSNIRKLLGRIGVDSRTALRALRRGIG